MTDTQSLKKEYEKVLQQLSSLLSQGEMRRSLSDPELISDSPAEASAKAGWSKFEELSKRKAYLEKLIEKQKELQDLKDKIEENQAIIAAKEDSELVALAETETAQLQEKIGALEKEIKSLLGAGEPSEFQQAVAEASPHLPERSEGRSQRTAFSSPASPVSARREMSRAQRTPSHSASPSSTILEIRAGAGGEEASLFAADLFRMYSKYASSQGWKQKVLDSKTTELGGFKEVIFEIDGQDVLNKIKSEAGVHRVQRIPKTEKSGRVHTSTVSVAVLPKPKKGRISINSRDLKTDTYKSSGPGGQYVNKRMTAVRITHLPTGLVVTSQTERSLLQNKENALSILGARLLEKKESEEEKKISGKRRSQIGKAKRAEKIRTYNFPQDRITDHRVKKSFHNIEAVMEGKLDPIISALLGGKH